MGVVRRDWQYLELRFTMRAYEFSFTIPWYQVSHMIAALRTASKRDLALLPTAAVTERPTAASTATVRNQQNMSGVFRSSWDLVDLQM